MKLLLLLLLFNAPKPHIDTTVKEPDYFIAMEYNGLSNRIYKVFITDSVIMGAKVNGYITVEPNFGIGTAIPKNVMHNPDAYVNESMDGKYVNNLSDYALFKNIDKSNFIIKRRDIIEVIYDREKKWGMGYYPHVGKIIIKTIKTPLNKSAERELILVGDQDPQSILVKLKKPGS